MQTPLVQLVASLNPLAGFLLVLLSKGRKGIGERRMNGGEE